MTSGRTAVFETILSAVRDQKIPSRPFLLYVSGVDASGKTHFAAGLAKHMAGAGLDVQLVHLDDFHHPKAHRYGDGHDLAEQYYTRSFDLDTLIHKILRPLRRDGYLDETLTLLDLASDSFTARRRYVVRAETVVIFEGVFLRQPRLEEFCDLFVQIEVPLALAFERAKARDVPTQGPEVLEKYATKYFPAQLRYKRACQPARKADFVIDNGNFDAPRVLKYSPELAACVHERTDRADGFWIKAVEGAACASPMHRFDAVCFDLWDTLVPLPSEVKERAFRVTAGILGFEPERLRPLWAKHRRKRESCDLKDFLSDFCRELGIEDSTAVVDKVIGERRIIHGRALNTPRADAELTLRMLRAAGYRIGLVSNCTSDVPNMLQGTTLQPLFDVEVYSCREEVLKPDRKIFLRACELLGVPPARCLYVGDGNDDELNGAASAGMTPVLLDTARGRECAGTRVKALSELLDLLII